MLIRSTAYECFVMLWNGLTLELVLDAGETRGIWLLGERYLREASVGSA
jgi:hypothetical protein